MLTELGVINLWTYVIGAILIILAPGPNTIFVLTVSMRKGVADGYKAALGVILGDITLIFGAFIGVASLVQASPGLFTAIKYAGAAYLFYLGLKLLYATFIAQNSLNTQEIQLTKDSVFRKALILSLTNPKAILFFVSFFVQFVDPNYPNPAIPFAILAVILESFALLYLSVLIVSGAALSAMFRERQALAKLGNSMVGALFIGFGAKLIATTS